MPVFFVEAPEPATASLTFRVGICDEDVARRGITHLVEHLALFALGRRDHAMNGFVALTTCTFYARGTQEELERFLQDVTESLVDLPLDRLSSEKRVLEREASVAIPSAVDRLLNLRFGATGFGGADLLELGMRWLGSEEVAAWRDECFTQGNAALWFHGPRPPEIELVLPDGERRALPPAEPLPGLTLPTFSAEGQGATAAGFLADRSWETTVGVGLARERLHDHLRVKEALAYDAWMDYVPLGPDRAHVAHGSDSGGPDGLRVARLVLDAIEEVVQHGPPEEDLERAKRLIERGYTEDPDVALRDLDRAAFEELIGGKVETTAQQIEELKAVTPDSVARQLAHARDDLVVLAPEGTPAPREDLSDYRKREMPDLPGELFKTKGLRQKNELRIGEAGVSLRMPNDALAIAADEVAAVVEESDGKLTVVALDNTWIRIDPAELREGERAAAAVRALAPGPLVPGGDDRAGWVKKLAEEKLPRWKWKVNDELRMLPEVLDRDEEPVTMAEASRGMRLGLLAVTRRRLLWLYSGGKDDVLAIPRSNILRAEKKRKALGGKMLRVTLAGEEIDFVDVNPGERLAEIAEELGGSRAAGGR